MHLFIHVLEPGEIPLYELEAERFYQWFGAAVGYDNRGNWEAQASPNRRLLIGTEIDEPLTVLVDQLSDRLRELPQPLIGTLIFVVRFASQFEGVIDWGIETGWISGPDRHGVLVLGGMAFVEGVHVGFDLEGAEPNYLVEQTCLLVAGKEYDRSTPGLENWRVQVEDDRRAKKLKRDRIEAKARAILTTHLDESQRSEFEASGSFHVVGADGATYLITPDRQHNVFKVENGRRVVEYCIVTRDLVPIHDQMLTQMLLLQANPTMFHDVTNSWNLEENGKRTLVHRSLHLENATRELIDDLLQL